MTNQLEELDRLRLNLSVEKTARLEYQLQELKRNFDTTQGAIQELKRKHEVLSAEVKARYNLSPGDSLDPETGLITRAEKPNGQDPRPASVAAN